MLPRSKLLMATVFLATSATTNPEQSNAAMCHLEEHDKVTVGSFDEVSLLAIATHKTLRRGMKNNALVQEDTMGDECEHLECLDCTEPGTDQPLSKFAGWKDYTAFSKRSSANPALCQETYTWNPSAMARVGDDAECFRIPAVKDGYFESEASMKKRVCQSCECSSKARLEASESTVHENGRWRKTLIMTDVDDTLTCSGGSKPGASMKERAAGVDNCPDMAPHEIYFGVGLFVYLLGSYQSTANDLFILSANPRATSYPQFNNYLATVSEGCMGNEGCLHCENALAVNGVEAGSWAQSASASASGDYWRMSIRKIESMIEKAQQTNPTKIVWLGDTGQGDVCAGLCFLYPEHCPDELKESAVNVEHAQIVADKYAFFHNVAEPEEAVIKGCYDMAMEQENIVFFGQPGAGNKRFDYKEAMEKACGMGLMDCADVTNMLDVDARRECVPIDRNVYEGH